MPTATERLVRGDWTVSAPLAEAPTPRCETPEWHSLRLFGRGRHAGAFDAGAEANDQL
jgi:hypothetical protein